MSLITTDRQRRKPEKYDRDVWDAAAQGSVTMIGQAQPPPGMVAQQPVQAPVAAPVPVQPAPVQPQAPAPIAPPAQTPAQQQALGGVVTPMFAPQTTPGQYQQIQQQYERSGLQAPPAPQPTLTPPPLPQDPNTPNGYKQQLDQATQQRKQATNARFKAAGKPVPYPEAEPTQQGPAEVPTSIVPQDIEDSELLEAISTHPEVKKRQELLNKLQGRKITPQIAEQVKKLRREVEPFARSITKSFKAKRAEQAKKDEMAQDAIDRANAAAERAAQASERGAQANERAAKSAGRAESSAARADADRERNKEAARLAGKAQSALGTGDHANAEKLAQEGLKLFPDTTAQAEFNTVLQGVRTAKAAAEKKAEVAATTKAAAALLPKVKIAKQIADDAEKALDATHKAIARIREDWDYKPENPPGSREQKLIAQEPAQRAEMERTRKEYWRLDQEHANVASGVQQTPPAGTQAAPGEPPTVLDEKAYNALPVGTEYRDAQGNVWRKK